MNKFLLALCMVSCGIHGFATKGETRPCAYAKSLKEQEKAARMQALQERLDGLDLLHTSVRVMEQHSGRMCDMVRAQIGVVVRRIEQDFSEKEIDEAYETERLAALKADSHDLRSKL